MNTSYLNTVLTMLHSKKKINFMPLDFYTRVYDTFAPSGVMLVGLTESDYDVLSSWER